MSQQVQEEVEAIICDLIDTSIENWSTENISYDETKDNLNYWMSIFRNGTENVAFWKRKRYEYQQEYR